MKIGDLVRINKSVHDHRFPECRTGTITNQPKPDLFTIQFENGFIAKLYFTFIEIISKK